jgi:short-subunit dehydrogenase
MPSFDLRGAVAVVTGAAGGIGAALADALSARGAHLALADVNAAGLEVVAARAKSHGVTVSAHPLDVGDREAVRALPEAVLAAHGRVSVLVNNAGVTVGGLFEDVSEKDFDWLMSINLHGVVWMTRDFLPLLRREPAAQIVNVSSLFGIIAPPGQAAYAASKFAVRGFSEALRHELAGSPVGLTLVHPGGVRTGIAANARRSALSDSETEAQAAQWERLLRLPPEAAAEQIAAAIERRAPRLLIGSDAKRAALMQRLFPETYWRRIAALSR